MPKKECCCNPVGRHVAVLCRYWGTHTIGSLNNDVGFTYGGISAGDPFNTGGGVGFGGPDGFQTVESGIQKFFGWTPQTPGFGNDGTGFRSRGPVRYFANIKQFDESRDVILLSRSGGGSSQYKREDDNVPKGGHSSCLQTRVKAALNLEGLAGFGGQEFLGGQPSIAGSNLIETDPFLIVGAGAGGGKSGYGGHGGISFGVSGGGPFAGFVGTKISGGCGGGTFGQDGGSFFGGAGANDAGGGGGGRYGGGGGDKGSGGGGGASKWPTTTQSALDDIIYSEPGSEDGPGDICNPFIPLYSLDTLAYQYHPGMGGGANNLASGFGVGFNPFQQGIPGSLTAIWIDRYCPCNHQGSTATVELESTNNNGVIVSSFKSLDEIESSSGGNSVETAEQNNSSVELPSKLYICLTEDQYKVINDFLIANNSQSQHVRFELDGQTYIYVGLCGSSYCSSVRLADGTPSNIHETDIPPLVGGPPVELYNDCCDVMICGKVCKINQADCYTCRCTNIDDCPVSTNLKYCCDDVDSKPDRYFSVSEGWIWQCVKRKRFWYPFGIKPEDTLPIEMASLAPLGPNAGPLEKGCFPVIAVGATAENELRNLCLEAIDNFDCQSFSSNDPSISPCVITIPPKKWGGKLKHEMTVEAKICSKVTPLGLPSGSGQPDNCSCMFSGDLVCRCQGCITDTRTYSATWAPCDNSSKDFGCQTFSSTEARITRSISSSIFPCPKEILGLKIRIARCHPDIENPKITDPLSAPNYPLIIGGGFNLNLCERRVNFGGGFLSDYVSAFNNLQTAIRFEILEGNIWIGTRSFFDECSGSEIPLPNSFNDILSRVEFVDTIDERVVSLFFKPAALLFSYTGTCDYLGSCDDQSVDESEPITSFCNSLCECISGKVYERGDSPCGFGVSRLESHAFSEPYYLYENNSGENPVLTNTNFVPLPESDGEPFCRGIISTIDFCEGSGIDPALSQGSGIASLPYSNCATLRFSECDIGFSFPILVSTEKETCRSSMNIRL